MITPQNFALIASLAMIGIVMIPSANVAQITSTQTQSQTPRQTQAAQLLQTGWQHYQNTEYEAAIAAYQEALTIFQNIRDRPGESQALTNLGLAYNASKNYQQAIEHHQQSLAIAQELDNKQQKGAILGNLGMSYSSWGKHTEAIPYFEQMLVIAREIDHIPGEGWALGRLANTHNTLRNYPQAIDYYQRALAVARKTGNRLEEGSALLGLGNSSSAAEDYVQAIDYLEQSFVIAQEQGNDYGQAYVLSELGNTYIYLGNYPKAIEKFQQGLALAQASDNSVAEINSLKGLANSYYSQRDFKNAVDYFEQALFVTRNIGYKTEQAGILGGLGNTYFYLNELDKAVAYLEQALHIAQETGDLTREAFALSSLGIAYESLGDNQQVINYLEQGLKIFRELENSYLESFTLHNLGTAYFRSGKIPESEKFYFQAMEVRESVRAKLGNNDTLKVSIADTNINSEIYKNLQLVLVAQDKTTAALEIAERGRSRAFVELLQERLSPEAATKATVTPPTIEQIQTIAQQQNATLVEYSIVGEQLYAWVVPPRGEIGFRNIELSNLEGSLIQLVTATRNDIFHRSPSRATPKLKQLYQLLIAPITSLLPQDPQAKVIFIPQGELFLLPFPALMDESEQYLIQKHTILTSPSIQLLELTRQKQEQIKQLGNQEALVVGRNRPATVVGNPVMPSLPGSSEPLQPLPGAENEAQAIAPLLNTEAILGSQATKNTIIEQISQSRIIHLATHGLLDDVEGLGFPGALALTPSHDDSGLLTANEIFNLRLNAELVVLSACDTGRGKITGDGVIGLSRSFISAGAASIVVSLWKVPDEPTALLMPEFYQHLEQNQGDKAQALRQAMLATLAQYPAPRNWAAFTLIGESES